MRLICPNCNAQYEIADDVIPPEGREVQCSSCSESWFQEPAKAPNLGAAAARSAAATDAPPRPRLDKSIADILREEAGMQGRGPARDATAAAAPAAAAASVTATRRPPADGEAVRGLRERVAAMQAEAEAANAAPAARSEMRPTSVITEDVDQINATLRARAAEARDVETPALTPRRRGFRRGMSLVIIVLGLSAGAYIFAPQIVEALPESRPYMVQYVAAVDDLRVTANEQIGRGLVAAEGFMVEQGWMEAPLAPAPEASAASAPEVATAEGAPAGEAAAEEPATETLANDG